MGTLHTLSTDDDLEIAFNKFHALLLALPQDTRFELLRRANSLYLGEKRRRNPKQPGDRRGQWWQDPDKRKATITAMRQVKRRREETLSADPPTQPVTAED